ncbi:SAM-dependent methyltransferase [Myxococcus fulvus]|uniref:SAM-dependent methyltransferase n=1 Tax=Myxococcus fulvus TaxID=33 RepID=UPI003B9D526F
MSASPTGYQIGHSDEEMRRLEFQAGVFRPLTESVLRGAGLRPGMRVLDVGCGVEDVSLLAAEFVGPSGEVVGIDGAAQPLEWARRRAREQGLSQARFEHRDLASLPREHPFDAVVERLVLLHQADPVHFLRQMGEHLRPGGLLICHEMDFTLPPVSHPPLPLLERTWDWLVRAVRGLDLRERMGSELTSLLREAGLQVEGGQCAGVLGVNADEDTAALKVFSEGIRAVLPAMERMRIARAEDVDIHTLEQRLRDEARAAHGMFVPFMMMGVWARRLAST